MKKDNSDIDLGPCIRCSHPKARWEGDRDGWPAPMPRRAKGGGFWVPSRAGGGRRANNQRVCSLSAGDEEAERETRASPMWTLVVNKKRKSKISAEQAAFSCASVALETIARKKARRVQSLQQAGESPRPSSFRRLSSTAALPRRFR